MTIAKLIALRAEAVPVSQLAHASLRYEQLRRMSASPEFIALVRSVIADHAPGVAYEQAFDSLVDRALVARASEQGAQL